jgi:hypothetical protein
VLTGDEKRFGFDVGLGFEFAVGGSRGVDQCRTEAAWRGASQARKSDETALPVR